jgi:hypothetical protein
VHPSDFENEFQFQLYKDSLPRPAPSNAGDQVGT